MRSESPDDAMTPRAVAKMFNVHVKTVTGWANANKLHPIRTPGGHRRYSRFEVNKFFREWTGREPPATT